ncbi:MAG TPA: sigma-54 dependent transcriptional regulator [Chthoniobacteraceae bacterium]|nr:sigma-54 dependent transcriptional regulator [Chthoniobacteraceae bacterium]
MSEPSAARILIADDEPLFLRTTAALLRKAGYHCTTAPTGQSALEALAREPFDLILSDLNMPGNLRLELLLEGRKKWPDTPLIVITGAPSLPSAIESVRLGITDYLLKPVKYDDLLSAVRRALAQRGRQDTRIAPAMESTRDASFPDIVGESEAMQELFEIIEKVADTDTSILITGESGTGKEVVARAIHARSRRAEGPLQVVDCTAIPETLFESVLFGHTKGAFTGAVKDQAGLLAEADGGTAFFDEIGELPHPLQAKLLRVIQEQTFTPVGKTSVVRVDMRFLCATNRDLELEVNAGRFRRDLFYRLAVIHIELPPLRERGEDVILLARHFLHHLKQEHRPAADFSEESLALLRRYTWPGNIRELRNAIERGVTMARGNEILPGDLPAAVQRGDLNGSRTRAQRSTGATRAETVDDAEREYLVSLLRENSGNVAQSARQAGLSRQGLHKLLAKHGVDAAEFRP